MMPEEKKYAVFISYSHEDEKLVSPVVKLLSNLSNNFIFQDINDIKPGEKWEAQLSKALDEADMIVIFWCKHSAKSMYVKKELETALFKKIKVLPVILDNHKLVNELAEYQWIDVRKVISHWRVGNLKYWLIFIISMSFISLVVFVVVNFRGGGGGGHSNESDYPFYIFVVIYSVLILSILLSFFILIRKLLLLLRRKRSLRKMAGVIIEKLNQKLPPQ